MDTAHELPFYTTVSRTSAGPKFIFAFGISVWSECAKHHYAEKICPIVLGHAHMEGKNGPRGRYISRTGQ
jgi:hypothetical protein